MLSSKSGGMCLAVGFVVAITAGCGPSSQGSGPGDAVDAGDGSGGSGGSGGGGGGEAKACNKIDLMFVVDNSGSMSEEQDNLAANFPEFISLLDGYTTSDGEQLDYRVAVTTTGRDFDLIVDAPPVNVPGGGTVDLPPVHNTMQGDNGSFRSGCGMSRRWMERADGMVGDTFSCVAEVGTDGPGIEMPLQATEDALSARMTDGTNQGFLRDDALLALVVLTDEDDCSMAGSSYTETDPFTGEECGANWPLVDIGQTVSFLDGVKGDRGRWATAVIAAPSDCSSDFGSATRAVRLQQFVSQTGNNAVFSSILRR